MVSNEDLVRLIQAGTDRADNLGRLYKQNSGMIAKLAKRYLWGGELEDLMQEGFFGLATAADRWDPDGGALFITYAVEWIRQAMQRYCENCGGVVRLPAYKVQRLLQYDNFLKDYEARTGREPSDEVLQAALQLSADQLDRLRLDAMARDVSSLEAPAFSDDGEATVADFIPGTEDSSSKLVEDIYQEELSGFLWSMVDELPADQANVLRWRCRDGLTLAECDTRMNAKKGRAARLEALGVRALQRTRPARRIAEFTGDRLFAAGVRGAGLSSYRRTGTSSTERAALDEIEREYMARYGLTMTV